jgi:hypothetical protein
MEMRRFMAEAQAGNPAVRAVVLSPGGALRSAVAGGGAALECIFVATAYEAAAELIAAPALAIVIDLRLMGPRHLRLLQIARERRVEMLAVGSIPPGLTAEDLSGIRLLARADVKPALQRLLQDRQDREGRYEPTTPPAVAPALSGARAEAAAVSGGQDGKTVGETRHDEAQRSRTPSPQAAPTPESPSGQSPDSLRNILTAGELAALLEERS